MRKVAIIGSGPTGIYTLQGLVGAKAPLSITVFEIEAEVGKGTPYHPDINDQSMLANIASIELPPICETLVVWLSRQPDQELNRLGVARHAINVREFYPRVVLGEYLQSQFRCLVQKGIESGHAIAVKPQHRVVDIQLQPRDIRLTIRMPDGEKKDYAFDHVVMATGHDWPETTEIRPGYFVSPWPAPTLKKIQPCSLGILGTSLSAIDALMTVSTSHGAFYLGPDGQLQYQPSEDTEDFHATLMSRKGLLPEADFYFDYPYASLQFCRAEAVDALLEQENLNLLDEIFELFKQELASADPEYASNIGLSILTVETFAAAYFAAREASDPFVWATSNLAEAESNKTKKHTVPWRYALLRMHEVVARAVPHFGKEDLTRFHKSFKAIFVDNYATVPHQSIQRLLALRRAGKLDIMALGKNYKINNGKNGCGAVLRTGDQEIKFEAFIDATGQSSMTAEDIPFPTLVDQGVMKPAATYESAIIVTEDENDDMTRTGGVDLDAAFRPNFEKPLCNNLYCVSISYLLHKMPFVQGITSAHELGGIVSRALLQTIDAEECFQQAATVN